MTDNEIIKALECCEDKQCNDCPYMYVTDCKERILNCVFSIFNRQQAEIERLQAECGNQSVLWSKHYEDIFETAKETAKAEAIKEFADRLKEKSKYVKRIPMGEYFEGVDVDDIDNLVKEMVGDDK